VERFCYKSPYGSVTLEGEGGCLWCAHLGRAASAAGDDAPPALVPFVTMLDGYFAGEPCECPGRLLGLQGLSAFRRRVYGELMRVPFGETVSYGELAAACGRRGAARAVGGALRANPLPIFVPCHRVLRADGTLGGFRAGRRWKTELLEHEGHAVHGGRVRTPCGMRQLG